MSLMQKLSRAEASAPPWSLFAALITFAVMLVALIVIGPALTSLLFNAQAVRPDILMISWLIGLVATSLYVVINRRSSQQSWAALRLQRGRLALPMTLLIGVAIALAVDLVVGLASGQFVPVPEVFGFQSFGAGGVLLAALLLALAQPVAETLVFQAVLLPALRWTLGPWRGVIATCLLYVLLHALVYYAPYQQAYDASWHGLALPFSICLTFSLLKVYADSSEAVIIARVSAGVIFLLTALALTGI